LFKNLNSLQIFYTNISQTSLKKTKSAVKLMVAAIIITKLFFAGSSPKIYKRYIKMLKPKHSDMTSFCFTANEMLGLGAVT